MIKQMGDEIIPSQEWNDKEEDLMYAVQLKKIQQNPALGATLIATGTCESVEATPSRKWGAGATLSSTILKKHEWPGDNKHGKIIMTVRAKLIRDAQVKEAATEKKKEKKETQSSNSAQE